MFTTNCLRSFLHHTIRLLVIVACLGGFAYQANAQDGLVIPTTHPRVWWTPERLQQARVWWSSHSFTPHSDDPWELAFAYVMTGNTQYGQAAVNLLMNFTISQDELDRVASDTYRWSPWVPIVYDWCYNLMTPTQVSTFMARYNNYTSILIAKEWGGPGFEGNNYYWGYLQNELNWAIATYYENPTAQTFLDDALVTRWQNGVLPYLCGRRQGRGTSGGIEVWLGDARVCRRAFHHGRSHGTGPLQRDQLVQGSCIQYDLRYVIDPHQFDLDAVFLRDR